MGLHVVELKGRAAYTRNSAPGCHFAGSLSGLAIRHCLNRRHYGHSISRISDDDYPVLIFVILGAPFSLFP